MIDYNQASQCRRCVRLRHFPRFRNFFTKSKPMTRKAIFKPVRKKTPAGFTWKLVATLMALLVVSAGGLVSVVIHYHFNWSVLADVTFYENLADPSIRIIPVPEGMRKEQVADLVGDNLGWTDTEKHDFEYTTLALANPATTTNVFTENNSRLVSQEDIASGGTSMEGYYFPKTYMLHVSDSPATVQQIMLGTFQQETSGIKKGKTTQIINQQTALTIASIIQREAAGNGDMNLISGIIWNRLFAGMKLQIDATVQYAKGNITDGWWPPVNPSDIKDIDSPYNTYMYANLPPTPIASPGLAAIEAAYNPQPTKCLFYLHDKNRHIHCSVTYAQHLANIAKYY